MRACGGLCGGRITTAHVFALFARVDITINPNK